MYKLSFAKCFTSMIGILCGKQNISGLAKISGMGLLWWEWAAKMVGSVAFSSFICVAEWKSPYILDLASRTMSQTDFYCLLGPQSRDLFNSRKWSNIGVILGVISPNSMCYLWGTKIQQIQINSQPMWAYMLWPIVPREKQGLLSYSSVSMSVDFSFKRIKPSKTE